VKPSLAKIYSTKIRFVEIDFPQLARTKACASKIYFEPARPSCPMIRLAPDVPNPNALFQNQELLATGHWPNDTKERI